MTARDAPGLLDRTFAAGCTRVAVISLHPGAGARTVLESIANEFHARGVAVGLTRAPRLALDAAAPRETIEPIRLPEGTIVATTPGLDDDGAEGAGSLEPLERIDGRTALGELGLFRVVRPGAVRLYGPDEPTSIVRAVAQLERQAGSLALIDGAWERKRFAAPEVAQGAILVVGAGYAGAPERSAAALRSAVELLSLPQCGPLPARQFREAGRRGAALALDRRGDVVAELPPGDRGPSGSLTEAAAERTEAVVLPDGLYDAFMAPLVRLSRRFELVVRDATRLHAAPIYTSAWAKGRGTVTVMEPMRVVAVASNPVHHAGPDADPTAFRELVAAAVPGVPVHDVRLEAVASRKRRWRLW